jgi:hypothetical protein
MVEMPWIGHCWQMLHSNIECKEQIGAVHYLCSPFFLFENWRAFFLPKSVLIAEI